MISHHNIHCVYTMICTVWLVFVFVVVIIIMQDYIHFLLFSYIVLFALSNYNERILLKWLCLKKKNLAIWFKKFSIWYFPQYCLGFYFAFILTYIPHSAHVFHFCMAIMPYNCAYAPLVSDYHKWLLVQKVGGDKLYKSDTW